MGPAISSPLESDGRLRRFLRQRVSIDMRTLAVFRVFVGLLVIADLLLRSRSFGVFYTDDGVASRSLVLEASSTTPVSVYHLTTDPTLIAALFVLQGLIAVQLIVGYRTRLATVLTFLFVISLDHHNPYVLSYADTLFRLLLFWAIFLPLGERWSVDAVHRAAGSNGSDTGTGAGAEAHRPRAAFAGVGSALILCQMVYMYFTNGLIKSQSGVWTGGDAAPLVLGMDEITFLLGDTISQFPALLRLGGLVWFTLLVSSPLLLLLRGRPRMLLAGLFAAGHLSFAVTVRIGAFAYVALAGLLLFLQGQFWDDLAAVATRLGIDTAALAARGRRLETLARRVPDIRLPEDADGTARRIRGHAYTVAVGLLVVTLLFVAVVMAATVGAAVVDDSSDQSLEDRVDGAILETLDESTGVAEVETAASSLGVNQPIGWGVFAGPDPRTTDRYHVFPAETADGDLVDAYNERPLTYDRPYDGQLQQQYDTYRERFYMNSVRSNDELAAALAADVCEAWADDHDEELVRLSMYLVEEDVTLETIDEPENRDREYTAVYRHGCGDNEPGEIQPPE